jgi:Tol biopolymer transport system component
MRGLVVLAALAALLVAGCGGSSRPKGPPPLLFVSTKDGDYALFGAEADGSHVYRLTKEKGDASSPAKLFFQIEPSWSADGRKIAFVSGRDGVGHVFVMRPDGTHTRRVTNTKKDDSHPSFSPDGKWIVFGREGALFRAPFEGGPATRLLKNAPGHAADPVYSPDGKLVAYDYRRPGFSIREVYVMNADGTGARTVTNLRWVSGYPAWSPDSKRLAFMSNAAGTHDHNEIYTMPLAGGKPKRQTFSATDAIQPAWTPDGALSYSLDGAIWLLRDGKYTKLTTGGNNDSAPAWNPKPPASK